MEGWHWALIGGLTLLHFLTFVTKPPHIDDTLYLATAEGILADPLRPLTNTINWEMIPRPIYTFAVNPPLYNYQQALIIKLFGWNIPLLHVLAAGYVFLAGVSVFYLARRFTRWPVAALLLFMLCPTFLPQTNLMLDVPGMALVAATVAAWIKGVDERSNRWMLIASLAATCALWTKYNSAVVIPLVLLYSVLRRRWFSMVWIAVPLAGFGLWCLHNYFFLPLGPKGQHTIHLFRAQDRFDTMPRLVWQQSALSLMSWGCSFLFLPALGVWAWLRRRPVVGVALFAPAIVFFIFEFIIAYGPQTGKGAGMYSAAVWAVKFLGFPFIQGNPAWNMPHYREYLVFIANALLMAGFILACCIGGWRPFGGRWRDGTVADDLFLLAWPLGMSLFNSMFAPHHTPRYYFPAYPAVPLLLIRALSRLDLDLSAWWRRVVWASIAAQAAVGLILVASDNTFAKASEESVARLAAHPKVQGKTVYHIGHWGFQYHAQKYQNFKVADIRQAPPPIGGLVAIVADTGPGEFPGWAPNVERGFALQTSYKDRSGAVHRLRFREVDRWDYPHPWPLQTVHLKNKFLIYSPRFYHNRLPYGHSAGRSHEVLLVERIE